MYDDESRFLNGDLENILDNTTWDMQAYKKYLVSTSKILSFVNFNQTNA